MLFSLSGAHQAQKIDQKLTNLHKISENPANSSRISPEFNIPQFFWGVRAGSGGKQLEGVGRYMFINYLA